MNYFEHHIGDYAEATAHLSFIEDAAYSRCIRKYYAKEKPLPADIDAVQRLVGARTKEEKSAVQTVLAEFFVLCDDGWRNARCDADIAEYQAGEPERESKKRNEETRLKRHREERAALFEILHGAGQHAPWNIRIDDLRKLAAAVASRSAGDDVPPLPATAPATPATATQTPIPNTHTPDTNINNKTVTAAPKGYPPEFEDVWDAYPSRPGASKKDAHRAWAARLKSGATAEEILAGVKRYATYVLYSRTESQYIKQPATFFGPGEHFRAAWEICQRPGAQQAPFDPVAHVNRGTQQRGGDNGIVDINPR